uniref:Thrombospondin-type laminin G domain and EAR repeat-containing protein-like n=1 Tax=Saccoglossus kowalevskii TaxID=10224 RepID=A0ABM0ML73_SACKO|nr:PREDICTED: thrombospondin-type laminin G domain and EAR repeat-containing protein-like [Saccoglossus kowalevskii]
MPIYRPFVVTTLSIMCGFTMIRDVVSLTDSVSLEQFQTIQTSSARRSHSYLVNQHLYLAVVNYNTQCDIYRLKGTQFSLVQHIKVNNANAARFFDVDGEYFLAIAKLTVNETQYNTVSPVLKFNNKSQQFETFQKFPSKGAFDWEYFHVCANEGRCNIF